MTRPEEDRDSGDKLPEFKDTYKTDAAFRKECAAFERLCADARAAGESEEGPQGGVLYELVFEARSCVAAVPPGESLAALARKGLLRRDLCNDDVRPVVRDLLAFAAKGGVLTEEEYAAREAAFEAVIGGPAPAVFRRLVVAAFPAQTCAVLDAAALAAVLGALAGEGRAAPLPAGASWLALGRAVHDALRAEWPWPEAPVRSAFARRLARAAPVVKNHTSGQFSTAVKPVRAAG